MNFKASNAANARDKWAARFSNYFKVSELKIKDADVQVAILLELAGPDSLAIHKAFTFAEGDNVNDYELVLRKFTDYCRPRKKAVYERYSFWKRDQECETIANGSLNSERKQPCASSDLKKNS